MEQIVKTPGMDDAPAFDSELAKKCNTFMLASNPVRKTFPVVIETTRNSEQKREHALDSFNEMTGFFSDYGNLTILLDNRLIEGSGPEDLQKEPLGAVISSPEVSNCDHNSRKNSDKYITISLSEAAAPPTTNVHLQETCRQNQVHSTGKTSTFLNPLNTVNNDAPEIVNVSSITRNIFNRNDDNVSLYNKSDSPIYISSDDEIVFVKEELQNDGLRARQHFALLQLKNKCAKKTMGVRRNPKRKAHVQKKYDVNFEFNFGTELDKKEKLVEVIKSRRTAPDKSTSKTSVQSRREWPVDGMHERPYFNQSKNCIEKFDHLCFKTQANSKKNDFGLSKSDSCLPSSAGCTKGAPSRRLNGNLPRVSAFSHSFVDITEIQLAKRCHETFHTLIDFVDEAKQASKLANAKYFHISLKNIMADSSILFSLTNHFTHGGVAKYLHCEFNN